jgi:hypothetical protein
VVQLALLRAANLAEDEEVMKFFRELVSDESAQCLGEYGLLISFAMLATLAVAAACHTSIAGIANTVGSNLAAGERFTDTATERAANKNATSALTHASVNKNFSRMVVAKSTNRSLQPDLEARSVHRRETRAWEVDPMF